METNCYAFRYGYKQQRSASCKVVEELKNVHSALCECEKNGSKIEFLIIGCIAKLFTLVIIGMPHKNESNTIIAVKASLTYLNLKRSFITGMNSSIIAVDMASVATSLKVRFQNFTN